MRDAIEGTLDHWLPAAERLYFGAELLTLDTYNSTVDDSSRTRVDPRSISVSGIVNLKLRVAEEVDDAPAAQRSRIPISP